MIRVILLLVAVVMLMGIAGEDERQAAEGLEGMSIRERAEIINAGYGRQVVEVVSETAICSAAESSAPESAGGFVSAVPVR